MKTPTPEEIASELAKLKALAPNIREYSEFGDDNRAAVDASIDVLSESMSLDDVYGRFGEDAFLDPEGFSQYVLDAAISTSDWMSGRLADGEDTPSQSWEGLAK